VGAGRGRLVRQLLTESVILSVLGGTAGLLIAMWGVRLLAALDPSQALRVQNLAGIGAVTFSDIHLDGQALGFAACLAIITGLVFGLVPALQSTQSSLTGALKEDAGGGDASSRLINSRNVLATVEIALAVVLLAGSGLMLRSLAKMLRVNPGFDADDTLTMVFGTPEQYGRDSLPGFYDAVLERSAALPGVTASALIDCPPLNGRCSGTVIAFRDQPEAVPGTEPEVGLHWITPSWTQLMRVPIIRGRNFTRDDREGVRKVVLVNEAAARKFWPGQDAIGRPVSVGQGGFWKDTAYVIGVVGDVRFESLDSAATPDVYLSYYQSPRGRMMLMLRSAGDPGALGAPARRLVREMLPSSPVYEMRTMRERVADAMRYLRFSTVILALFGLVALALATMGTYGVISFGVAQRTREIGIRVALGAQRGELLGMIVRQGLMLSLVGAAIGLVAALAATRVLRSLLFEVLPTDPLTFGAIVAMLVLAVLAASWIPARRAATIDPSEALREG
jgi:putative ABC transport system permease protein